MPLTFAMQKAIELANLGRWKTAPNPCVGAVLVRSGQIVASGYHQAYGQAHAEINCLRHAQEQGLDVSDCTLVVTLEPCQHQGKTPPCTEAILAAGIKKIAVGCLDPNPKASGGAAYLASQGLEVKVGILEAECKDLIADFTIWQTTSRPYVILKLATTLDGRIATRTGHSQWISCLEARQQVHQLRTQVGQAKGVVLIGGNTLHQDNPNLTARNAQAEVLIVDQPLAAAITSRMPSPTLNLIKNRPQQTIIFTTASGAATPKAAALRQLGVRIFGIEYWKSDAGEDLKQMLTHLRQEEHCPYVLCEGGGQLALALLQSQLVDEFHVHLAPKILGDVEAKPMFSGLTPLTMDEALGLRLTYCQPCGTDCHLIFKPLLELPPEN